MTKLAKMGVIGFGVFAFSEIFGITGEAQAIASCIIDGMLDEEEFYEKMDEDLVSGYTRFKIKAVKKFTKCMLMYLDKR